MVPMNAARMLSYTGALKRFSPNRARSPRATDTSWRPATTYRRPTG
jgi:hypothetical protein